MSRTRIICTHGCGFPIAYCKCEKPVSASDSGLLPCPFCGGEAKLKTVGLTTIICTDCSMAVSNFERGIAKLRGQWNTRIEGGEV